MGRGFLAGAIWGLVAVAGLAVLAALVLPGVDAPGEAPDAVANARPEAEAPDRAAAEVADGDVSTAEAADAGAPLSAPGEDAVAGTGAAAADAVLPAPDLAAADPVPDLAPDPAPDPVPAPEPDLPTARAGVSADRGESLAPAPPPALAAGEDRLAAAEAPPAPAVAPRVALPPPSGAAASPHAQAEADPAPRTDEPGGAPMPGSADAAPGRLGTPVTAEAPDRPQDAAAEAAPPTAAPAEEPGPVAAIPTPPAEAPTATVPEALTGAVKGAAESPALPDTAPAPALPREAAAAEAAAGAPPATEPQVTTAAPEPPGPAAGEAAPAPPGETVPANATAAADAPVPAGDSGGDPVRDAAPPPVVITDRLPRIGAAPAEDAAAAEAAPQGALARNRIAFAAPEGPRLALVLEVAAGDAAQAEAIAALPFPVTVALDPAAPGAAEAAAAFRAAGREVVLMATEIPEGATPSDLEVTFGAHFAAVPGAVAVLDLAGGAVQESRMRAQQVGVILAAEGYGLLADEGGLNTAAQVAGGLGLPHAGVARRITEAGALRQGLERAAFRAAQRGAAVAVIAATPELVAGLAEWYGAGRAAPLALVPVSVALLTP